MSMFLPLLSGKSSSFAFPFPPCCAPSVQLHKEQRMPLREPCWSLPFILLLLDHYFSSPSPHSSVSFLPLFLPSCCPPHPPPPAHPTLNSPLFPPLPSLQLLKVQRLLLSEPWRSALHSSVRRGMEPLAHCGGE